MSTNKRSIELNNSHSLDDAMREFGRAHRLDLLSLKIGCSANVLRNKLNPDQEFHKLTLLETVLLTLNTGDFSLFRSSLQMLNHDVHSVEQGACESRILHLILQAVGSAGNITTIFDKANEDQHLDDDEIGELIQATNESIKVLQQLNGSLKAKKAA